MDLEAQRDGNYSFGSVKSIRKEKETRKIEILVRGKRMGQNTCVALTDAFPFSFQPEALDESEE